MRVDVVKHAKPPRVALLKRRIREQTLIDDDERVSCYLEEVLDARRRFEMRSVPLESNTVRSACQ